MKILEFPLARITLLFLSGIVFSFFANPKPVYVFGFSIVCFAVLLACHFLVKRAGHRVYFSLIIYATGFFAGTTTHMVRSGLFFKSNYIHRIQNSEASYLIALTVREKLKPSPANQRFVAIIQSIDGIPASGKILLNFHSNGHSLGVGHNLVINGSIRKHGLPMNPDQFDYGKYLSNKSIYAQVYASNNNALIHHEVKKDIWYYSDRLRNRIMLNLRKTGFDEEALQVSNALILGQQQDISPDIIKDYQWAGAVHILSVSGLHVGFILLFLNALLKPLPKNKPGRIAKLLVILFSLWSFSILAGLSPSVVRSATMFSFVALGMSMRRPTNIFHTLLVSLLLILLFEPSFLFDVGFQLSYTALFFILWLQPLFSGWWTPKSKIAKYFWDILTVSFAAQIGAFPLSIYYFHQFPGLFFATNLVIIPFLSVIMILGVAVMLMAAVGCVPGFPARLLEWAIQTMNTTIAKIAALERFVFLDIPFNMVLLVSSYLLIVTGFIWLKKIGFRKLAAAMASVIIFQLCFFMTQWQAQTRQELTIFHIRKKTLVTQRTGQHVLTYHSDSLAKIPNLQSYLTAQFCVLEKKRPMPNVLFFDNHKILVLDSTGIYPTNADPDLLLLTKSPKINLERLLERQRPKVVIADGSNFKTYIARWKATCAKEKIPFHHTGEKGFYRLEK